MPKLQVKNQVLVRKSTDESAAFSVKRKSGRAEVDLYEGTKIVQSLAVPAKEADRLYVKLLDDGYEIAF